MVYFCFMPGISKCSGVKLKLRIHIKLTPCKMVIHFKAYFNPNFITLLSFGIKKVAEINLSLLGEKSYADLAFSNANLK